MENRVLREINELLHSYSPPVSSWLYNASMFVKLMTDLNCYSIRVFSPSNDPKGAEPDE